MLQATMRGVSGQDDAGVAPTDDTGASSWAEPIAFGIGLLSVIAPEEGVMRAGCGFDGFGCPGYRPAQREWLFGRKGQDVSSDGYPSIGW